MSRDSQLDSDQLLGAVDIVEAFTTLRHELKLQVRSGRELQQVIDQRLVQLENRVNEQLAWVKNIDLASLATPPLAATSQEARQLAEAIAEIEENLQRAVETLGAPLALLPQQTQLQDQARWILEQFDRTVNESSWASKFLARPLLAQLRMLIENSGNHQPPATADPNCERLEVSRRGLELLLDRVRRLMMACELERHDVLGHAFDAETMRAIDVVPSSTVPSAHVAEQLRPLYRWQGQVLKFADVRLAK